MTVFWALFLLFQLFLLEAETFSFEALKNRTNGIATELFFNKINKKEKSAKISANMMKNHFSPRFVFLTIDFEFQRCRASNIRSTLNCMHFNVTALHSPGNQIRQRFS